MKLSIVTSFYNSENYIKELSESILSQSYKDWEWIIADDFSTDKTKEKLIALANHDKRIKIVEPNYKKEIWWNPQLHATGDIVCPIDGDDKILPNTFEKIVYYFKKFPDVIFLHFNANKHQDNLPDSKDNFLNSFINNVYISRDNDSFLEAFERLTPDRSGIFGYLRIFRNIPNLNFKVHEDSDVCTSNDAQWLINLEEKGKWLTIPRTTYLARQHWDSENFRNWNIRGEVVLIKEAKERRKKLNLIYPRKNNFFDDVYEAAESTYLSKLNWENKRCKVGFFNFHYDQKQLEKLKVLFFDHDIFLDEFIELDYAFIRINSFDNGDKILNIAKKINCIINYFCDNTHLQNNNRSGKNNLEEIVEKIKSKSPIYFNYQDHRAIFIELNPTTNNNIMKIDNNQTEFKDILLNGYEKSPILSKTKKKKNVEVSLNYFKEPKINLECDDQTEVKFRFFDEETKTLLYETTLKNNMFAQLNREYHKDFFIEYKVENEKHILKPSFENQRVYIHLDSSSLGDTIAWFPQVDEFRKTHNAKVICSTFHNDFFEKNYPEIEFIKPGSIVHNLYKMFTIGWFYDDKNEFVSSKNPLNFRDQHLQKTATDILGLDFKEVKPNIDFIPNERPISNKYFCMANHSTAQAKYWNNPNGWQEVVDYIKSKGYDVLLLSKEPDNYMGNKNPEGVIKIDGKSIKEICNILYHSEGFIGLGSGLSWVAWALNKKVFLISGFSRPNCEMTDCERIFVNDTLNTCNGCFNDFRLDPADWNWCPRHKGTSRQFECTKSISSNTVIEKLSKFI
jgi:autotransporter strand-loop-strand O-heptosyltransferase